jgi:SAM-dependent methyltransferase
MSSGDRFGFEWDRYRHIQPYRQQYKDQLLNWIHPLKPSFFANKKILDAGCGMGRNSYWALAWGARELVAFDVNRRTVSAAKHTLRQFSNAKVKMADIYKLPWKNEFDFVFSIGVIHHLRDPKKGIAQLHQALVPGGEVLIWVYSRVGFESWLPILNPVRKYFTSKLPPTLLHNLTYGISVPFYIYLRLVHPKKLYFQQLRQFRFFHLHSILFDQLLPTIARYYSREQARKLLSGFTNVTITAPPNGNGWIVRGKKSVSCAGQSSDRTTAETPPGSKSACDNRPCLACADALTG